MSLSRNSLKSILEAAFSDQKLKDSCILTSRDAILSGLTTRAFDQFPTLLPAQTINDFVAKFTNILININSEELQKTDHGFLLVENKDKRPLIKLQKKIIDIGCRNLINSNGTIKKEICKLLQWEQLAPKIDSIELVSAYLSTINSSIMDQASSLIQEYQQSYAAICQYLNYYNRSFIVETFKSSKIPCHERHYLNLKHDHSLDTLSNEDLNALGLGLGVGAATLAGLALIGYAIFKNTENNVPAPHLAHPPSPKW